MIHSGTGLSGYLEKLASRVRIFFTAPSRHLRLLSVALQNHPLSSGGNSYRLQEVSWTIPCAMSSRAFPSSFAFKKAEKKGPL
ncbi:hypothetical protein HMPREF3038_02881 [Akkermansia sp. KLE1797]|nr:hypothetical protein HMPREF3038_02881 [Akkermansia sp. KLE1797]KXU52649.1 hypothetical protein HMPREF3039_03174 [Akkermansia sp. KLE1798]KZA04077.1 hypothetical protein HMPREF1326_02275 [Akkermansia sp. KLE1605]